MGLRLIEVSSHLIEQAFHLPGHIHRSYDIPCFGHETKCSGIVLVVDDPSKPELREGDVIPQMRGTFTEVYGDNGKVIRLEAKWNDV